MNVINTSNLQSFALLEIIKGHLKKNTMPYYDMHTFSQMFDCEDMWFFEDYKIKTVCH